MGNWSAVITNAGATMLSRWVTGSVIKIVSVCGGSGTVDREGLMAQTDLVNQRQVGNLLAQQKMGGGVRIRVQFPACDTAYTLTQVKIMATLDDSEPVMLALCQNNSGGVLIPAAADAPDFVYTFYPLLAVSNEVDIEVNVDTSATVSLEELETHNSDAYAHNAAFEAYYRSTRLVVDERERDALLTDYGIGESNTVTYKSGHYAILLAVTDMESRVNAVEGKLDTLLNAINEKV